ncbi:GtrA family protein [Candidatus Parcubacteria bacterium]|nr:GtrA family protein [Candidatus Parcubacteria bacterium]
MAEKKRKLVSPFGEYVRFGITGVLNTGTDFIVLNGLLTAFGGAQGGLYIASKAASFSAAVIQSYFLNKYWVFDAAKTGAGADEKGRFLAVSIAGLLLNVAGSSLVFGLLGFTGISDFRIKANIGAIAGTLMVLVWNYMGYKFFVFRTAPLKK